MKVSVLLYATVCLAYSTLVNLLQVNDKNFKEIVQGSGKFTFVDFYADWCRHCKQLMPTIEKLADLFEPYSEVIQVVKINGDLDGKRMLKKYVDIGYPTMLMFHGNDEPIEFKGSRDFKSLSNFIQRISGVRLGLDPASIQAPAEIVRSFADNIVPASDIDFEEIVLSEPKLSVVVFTGATCTACKDFWPTVEYLAEAFKKDSDLVQFVSVTTGGINSTSILIDSYNVKRVPSLLFFDPELTFVDEDGFIAPIKAKGTSLQNLIDQVNELTGLFRDEEGRLTKDAGRIPSVDSLIGKKDSKEVLEHLRGVEHEMVPYYKKLLNKVINGESVFFKSEIARLVKILENDVEKLNGKTVDSMEKRLNVLRVFA